MKLRNRIMSAVMALVASMTFIGATAFAADGAVSLKASSTEVKAGETFTIDVSVDSNPGIYYLAYEVTGKTDAFALTGATDTKLFAGATLDKDYNKASYALSWFIDELAESDNTDTGVAVTLTYTVNADATPGAYTINIADAGSDNIDFTGVDMGSNSITINVVADAPAKEAYAIAEESKASEVVDGLYTQGFKAVVTPNDDVVNAVNFTLANGDKTYADGWSGLSLAVESTFAINVLNVPADQTVTCDWAVVVAE